MRDAFPRTPVKGVAHELSFRITTLAPALLGPPTSRQGDTWRWRSRGSLAVHVSGPKRGHFRDYESGEHGDALDLIRHALGLPTRDACRWGAEWLGGGAVPAPPQRLHAVPTGRAVDRRDLARRIWSESLPPGGSPVETYLGMRGLALTPDLPLRYHPRCPRGTELRPAMVARVDCPISGAPLGVHRTFLRPDGSGKAAVEPAKMLLGGAGSIRLVDEVTIGLGIAEGSRRPSRSCSTRRGARCGPLARRRASRPSPSCKASTRSRFSSTPTTAARVSGPGCPARLAGGQRDGKRMFGARLPGRTSLTRFVEMASERPAGRRRAAQP